MLNLGNLGHKNQLYSLHKDMCKLKSQEFWDFEIPQCELGLINKEPYLISTFIYSNYLKLQIINFI